MPSKYGKGKKVMPVKVKNPKTGQVFIRQQKVGTDKLEGPYYDNFGVHLSGDLNGYTNDMLYKGLYLLNQAMPVKELNKMHNLTIHVTDNFDEDSKKASNFITGKYVDEQSTIFISPKFSQSLAHEYGHYIKDVILTTSDKQSIAKLHAFVHGLKATDLVDRVKEFDFKKPEEKEKYMAWVSSPDELFAKYFEQFIAFKLKGVKNNFIAHNYDEYSQKPQFFNDYEFRSRVSDFEQLMKTTLGNEAIEKTLDFLLSI